MATPFKLKSGNASSFKNMGSSPVKQRGDNLKRIMSEKKAIAKQTGTFYAPGAEPKVNKGSMPKNFNVKGSAGSTTPGYKSTKVAKTAKAKAFKDFDKWHKTITDKPGGTTKSVISKKPISTLSSTTKAMKNVPQQFAKKATKQVLKKGVKKVASRAIGGPVGAVLGAAYGAYKSGQKHSGGKAVKGQKSFMADAKKNTKSVFKKKSPAKQKDNPARTGVGHIGKGFNIKGYLKGEQGLIPDYKGQSTKKTVKKVKSKIKSKVRRAKIAADQIPYVGPSSSVYSTYAKAKEGYFHDPKATVNQPGYEKEKAQILKNKGWSTKKK